jgi:hypothetical protein
MTEEAQELHRLRRLCGEGKPGVWIPPGLSLETLKATAVLGQWLEVQDQGGREVGIAGASINERSFVGAYKQPSGPEKYHADRRHVRELLARRAR